MRNSERAETELEVVDIDALQVCTCTEPCGRRSVRKWLGHVLAVLGLDDFTWVYSQHHKDVIV